MIDRKTRLFATRGGKAIRDPDVAIRLGAWDALADSREVLSTDADAFVVANDPFSGISIVRREFAVVFALPVLDSFKRSANA